VTPLVRLLGLDFAALDEAAALDWLLRRSPEAPFGYIVTPNADHLTRLDRRPDLRPLYEAAALRLLDSRILALLARALALPIPPVVTGSDLTVGLARAVHEPVTVIGLDPRFVGMLPFPVVAHYDPPRGFTERPAELARAVDFVLAHPARFTFLAVGSRGRKSSPPGSSPPVGRGAWACALAPAWSFWWGPRPVRRSGCEARGWNGCTGWPAIRSG